VKDAGSLKLLRLNLFSFRLYLLHVSPFVVTTGTALNGASQS
jgi:hypothetical protein